MIGWFNSLDALQRVFALIAIPSTVILLIQTILFFFGLGSDSDADGDGLADSTGGDDGFALFSVRSVMAMLCVGGWSGIVLAEYMPSAPAVIIAAVIGFVALICMALLIKLILRLQSNGNIALSNAIGKVGQVYIPIPGNMSGHGKITLTIQDNFTEIEAVTGDENTIRTGETVRVVSTDEMGLVVVERIMPKKNGLS
ncbi:MAG: hypothetical protein WCQ72_07500 [Eubacteriales bacterium]